MSHGQGPSPLSATRPGDEVKLSLEEPLIHEKDSLTNPSPTNPSVGGTTTLDAGKISEGETEGYGTTRGRAPSRIGIGERKGIAAAKQEGKNVVAASKRGEVITYYDGKSHKYADHEAKRREWEETAHIYQAKEKTKDRAWEEGDDFQLVPQEPHTQPKDPYQMPEPVVDPYASASKSDGTYMSVYEGQEYKPATYEVSEYTSVYDRKV